MGRVEARPCFILNTRMLSNLTKKLLLLLGFLSLGLGIVGVFLPVWPTTPFILLSAWLFAKSSERYYRWLHNNRYFGDALRAWEAGEGLSLKVKWRMVVIATVFIGISVVICPSHLGRFALLLVWLIPIAVAIFTKTRA
jgi:uncharacterized membrane protein YbaN (DUF454 family)